jgi:hypothetical protein
VAESGTSRQRCEQGLINQEKKLNGKTRWTGSKQSESATFSLHERLVFTAGVVPLGANGALVGAGDFIAQTVQVLSNLEAAQKEKRLPTVRKGTSQDTPCCSARNSPTGSTKRKAFHRHRKVFRFTTFGQIRPFERQPCDNGRFRILFPIILDH